MYFYRYEKQIYPICSYFFFTIARQFVPLTPKKIIANKFRNNQKWVDNYTNKQQLHNMQNSIPSKK